MILSRARSWGRARWGVALMFFTNGAVMAALMPRYPELKAALGLSNSAFGLLVAAVALGSIAASHLPGVAIRRFGARPTATAGTVLMAAAMACVGFAPAAWGVALLLAGLGFLDAVVDAAQNVHGLRVERGLGKTVINSLHASWSVGAALGGLASALAAAAGLPLGAHLVLSGVAVVVVALCGCRLAAPPGPAVPGTVSPVPPDGSEPGPGPDALPVDSDGPDDAENRDDPEARGAVRTSPRLGAWAFLLLMALLAVVGAMMEDVGNNWSANFLHQQAGLGTAAAGLGYVTLLAFQFLGRILGDPLTDRLGRARVARLGGACILVGFALVVALPGAVTGFLAFALAGFGCATLIPAAYAEADEAPGLRAGSGITVVGWLMRLGFLGTSPAVGWLADVVSLRAAFTVPLAGGAIVVLIATLLLCRERAQA